MSEAIEARLDRIESQFEIHDLVSNYCHGFDKREWVRFIGIWWENAIWKIGPPFGDFEGHEGIAHVTRDILWSAWQASSHFTTNLVIEFNGDDRASGICDVDCIGTTSDGIAQTISATYRDHYERRNGIWKIILRNVTMHHFSPLPGVSLNPPE